MKLFLGFMFLAVVVGLVSERIGWKQLAIFLVAATALAIAYFQFPDMM